MKILIITDAHLFHRYAITTTKYHDILKNEDYDIVVDCGDLTNNSSLMAPQLDKISHIYDDINKPVYIIAGNHDSLSGTTIASIFNMKNNIKIITKPTILDNMLFVPYTDDIKTLSQKLDAIVEDQLDFMFSHLNLTSNFYATIPFKDAKILHKYAETIFNGHIHTIEENKTIFGKIYNLGSCSNLTFGDDHIPCYSIYDTKTKTLSKVEIEKSIIHKNYKIYDVESIDEILEDIGKRFSKYKLRCKFYLYNTPESIYIRKQINDKIKNEENVIGCVFDYIKQSDNKSKQIKKVENKKQDTKSLCIKLIDLFEENTNILLQDEIKKELLEN